VRPRVAITLIFFAVLLALGVTSFYRNVMNPHKGDAAMVGMAIPKEGKQTQTSPAGGASAEPPVPSSLAELAVTGVIAGAEAKAEVEQLHGKGLGSGFQAAWIAHYGAPEQATVWVSRSARAEDAGELLLRMQERIAQGGSPFTSPSILERDGVSVNALDGMGQKHFYFRLDADVYWLAISADRAEAGLSELIAAARKALGA
jgi:hypothetical protein